jgi:hypothetical protein
MCVQLYMLRENYIGAESMLPYLDRALTGNALLRGANFAFAGVGILNHKRIQFVSTSILVGLILYILIILEIFYFKISEVEIGIESCYNENGYRSSVKI